MKPRITLGTMMVLVILVALALVAWRVRTRGSLTIACAVTILAILASAIAAHELRGRKSSFAFGFALFGLAYLLGVQPWNWSLSPKLGFLVSVPPGMPAADLIYDVAVRISGEFPLPTDGGYPEVYDIWANRVNASLGILHLSIAWVFGAVGGLVGIAFASLRDRQMKGSA